MESQQPLITIFDGAKKKTILKSLQQVKERFTEIVTSNPYRTILNDVIDKLSRDENNCKISTYNLK